MKLHFTVAAALAATIATAQVPSATWGGDNSIPFKEGSSEVIGTDGANIFVVHDNKVMLNQQAELQVYGMDGNLKSKCELIPPGSQGVQGDEKLYRSTVFAGGHAIKISEGWLGASKTSSCLVQKVSAAGAMDEEFTTLVETSAPGQLRAPHYYPAVSPDQKKLAILTAYGIEKGSNTRVHVRMFDAASLSKLWDKELDLGFPSMKGKVYEFAIDNNGNAYVYKNAKVDKKVFKHFVFTTQGKSMKKNELKLGERFMNTVEFGHDAAGNVVLVGLGSPKNNKDFDAIFHARFKSADGSLAAQKLEEIGADMMGLIGGKAGSALADYELQGIAAYSNGTVAALVEYVKTERKSVEGQLGVYDYTYNKGNVLVFGLAADGSRAWNSMVGKTQQIAVRGRDAEFDSFGYAVVGDQLHIIYNHTSLPSSWTENNGTQLSRSNEFGNNAAYAPFLETIDSNGKRLYGTLKYGKPLGTITLSNVASMALYPAGIKQFGAGAVVFQRTIAPGKCKVGVLK